MAAIQEITLEGHPCLQMTAGDYLCILAPGIGNNMIRFRDNKRKIDVFRFDEQHPYSSPANNPETYGYPFLYLPNRLDNGVLKTSEATYQLPVNEPGPFYNCLHGFLHKRAYSVVEQRVLSDNSVQVVSEYTYDERDLFFSYFPVPFTLRMTYTLSADDGLRQEVAMRNTSTHMLPCGFCSHTPLKAPFVDGTKETDYVLCVPIKERWELTNRCLPTERRHPLTPYDSRYNAGTMDCVNHNIDNDLYTGAMNTLDGQAFHGAYATHVESGLRICYEVSEQYRFWCVWNDRGEHGYFCPEPCTWMINAPNLSLPPEQTGYTEIAPGETYTCWQHIFTR